MRVVQTDPGPMPNFTMSAPARIICSVASGVQTFPATIIALECLSLTLFINVKNLSVYPFAMSIQIHVGV